MRRSGGCPLRSEPGGGISPGVTTLCAGGWLGMEGAVGEGLRETGSRASVMGEVEVGRVF